MDINRRLNPSITDSDYYTLVKIRESLRIAIDENLSDKSNLAILDYGCGDIPYKPLFKGKYDKYIAADIETNDLADLHVSSDGQIPVEDEYFDLVISVQVLEHVPDVSAYLREAYRVLKPGGLLLLSTHGWWTYHPFPLDLWRWTRAGLIKILEDNRFLVTDSKWILGMLAYSYQLRVQCFKGLLEERGALAVIIFRLISAIYQKLMWLSDKIIPASIAQDNSAIYLMIARK